MHLTVHILLAWILTTYTENELKAYTLYSILNLYFSQGEDYVSLFTTTVLFLLLETQVKI